LDAHAHLGVFVFEGVRTRRSAGMRRARTASGATKTKVLGALSLDGAMTAGDVAKATGLGHGTVSTTLSKLAKTGEVIKAERGYRLPAQSEPAVPQGGSTEA
jgi:DNA-binding transcriptional ArsR family regulator